MATDKRQFTMRMQPENYDKIRVIAAINKRSIAAQIEYLLEQCINAYETEHGVITLLPIAKNKDGIHGNGGGNNYGVVGGNFNSNVTIR